MARCKLTRMSLRNIRKDKQYQCIIIDLVRTGVISKSTAEGLLSYTIPAGLLENSAYVPDADDEPGTGSGGDEPGAGSGGDSGSAEATTLKVNIGTIYSNSGIWSLSQVYEPKAGNPLEIKVEVPTDVVTRLNSTIKAAAESNNDVDVTSNADWLAFSTALSTAVQTAIENNPDIKTSLGYSSDTNLTIMPSYQRANYFCLLDKNGNDGTALIAHTAGDSKTYMSAGYNYPSDTSSYTDFLNPDTVYVVGVSAEE